MPRTHSRIHWWRHCRQPAQQLAPTPLLVTYIRPTTASNHRLTWFWRTRWHSAVGCVVIPSSHHVLLSHVCRISGRLKREVELQNKLTVESIQFADWHWTLHCLPLGVDCWSSRINISGKLHSTTTIDHSPVIDDVRRRSKAEVSRVQTLQYIIAVFAECQLN